MTPHTLPSTAAPPSPGSGSKGDQTERLLTTLGAKVAPHRAAVLVIDVQNDFVADGGFGAVSGKDLTLNQDAARRICDLLPAARSADVPVIFVRAIYDETFLSNAMRERNLRRGMTSPRCITGTWGAEFYEVKPGPGEIIVTKHRYSAFVGTHLDDMLRSLGVDTVILTGVYTDGCVEATARDAYHRDFYVVLVADCCGAATVSAHDAALARCDYLLGVVAPSSAVVKAWHTESGRS